MSPPCLQEEEGQPHRPPAQEGHLRHARATSVHLPTVGFI